MDTNIQFGQHCRKCNVTVGVLVGGGGCPRCGGPFVAASATQVGDALVNATCSNCGGRAGLVIGGPGPALCHCGGRYI